ncbi:MAG: hypothetical protein Kow0099_24310 [Candidatus Abyssubacteria bacterium]
MPLKFTRTKHVGIERPAKDKVIAHGFLDDYIYSMELDVEFSLPAYEISSIIGRMKRYTTPECPRADEILNRAVGMRIEPGLTEKVKKQIGRAGCRHYATLLMECCYAVISASIGFARQDLEDEGLPADEESVRRRLLEMLPSIDNRCMVYRKQD